jgi:bacillithiol biosynthesis deacetylase BshB1
MNPIRPMRRSGSRGRSSGDVGPTFRSGASPKYTSAVLDLLAFGPHPDDIEIGMGATVAHHAALGLSVGLCDLTQGEMGSNGTPAERLTEAETARVVLGAAWRENLAWRDREIGRDPAHVEQVVALIRRHQPRVIAVPYWEDRHPDHVAASAVLTEGIFNAGLRRYQPSGDESWKPDWVCYYFINNAATPSFVIDVSEAYARKREALDCHVTQFGAPPGSSQTRLNTPLFRQLVESRDAQFGALTGVAWAEGFVVRETIVRATLMKAPA